MWATNYLFKKLIRTPSFMKGTKKFVRKKIKTYFHQVSYEDARQGVTGCSNINIYFSCTYGNFLSFVNFMGYKEIANHFQVTN